LKRLVAWILVFTLGFGMLLSACGKPEEEVIEAVKPEIAQQPEKEEPKVEEKSEEPEEPVEPEEPKIYEPLTGLETTVDYGNSRPYAVMINNISVALPQEGNSGADIIYEMQVEGGITRMMGVYQDFTDVPVIGSIRSSRPYYVEVADSLDAIYVHAGGSDGAYSYMSSIGYDHIDGLQGYATMFYRDSDRRASMGLEHSLMLDTAGLMEYMEKSDIRKHHEEGYSFSMTFADTDSAGSGSGADTVTAAFSGNKKTIFEFDASSGLYGVSQHGSAYIDNASGEQVSVKNVVVLFAPFSNIEGDAKGRLETQLVGSGEGYYFANGKYIPITWERSDSRGSFTYKDASGNVVEFARGKSYFCVMSTSSTVDIAA